MKTPKYEIGQTLVYPRVSFSENDDLELQVVTCAVYGIEVCGDSFDYKIRFQKEKGNWGHTSVDEGRLYLSHSSARLFAEKVQRQKMEKLRKDCQETYDREEERIAGKIEQNTILIERSFAKDKDE